MDGVEVCLSLPPALDADATGLFQFADELGHPCAAHAHVQGKSFLAGKAGIVVPRVTEEHGVNDLGAEGELGVPEDEIGDLGKTTPQDGIVGVEQQVLLLKEFPDGLHVC